MKKISIVVPCYNEQEVLPLFYIEIQKVMQQIQEEHADTEFELLFINDGSRDGTLAKLRELAKQDERVRYISFSRNFGKESGMYAGLENATGDYVVIMDAELTSVQRISCLQRAAAERLSKKKLLEIILNDAFAEKPIDEPDEICYNITNTSGDGADQAQFESPLRCVAKRKRGVVRCGRRKISSLVSYCCSLASDFLSTAYCFLYLQAWLGSS